MKKKDIIENTTQEKAARLGTVYLFTFPNKKQYVGSTMGSLTHRQRCHLNDTKPLVSKALVEFGGFDNVEVRRLATNIEKPSLLDLEKFYTRHHNTLTPNGYNEKCGMDWPAELRKRVSDSWTPEMRSAKGFEQSKTWTPVRKANRTQFLYDWWTPEKKAMRRQQELDYWTPEKRAGYTAIEKARKGFVTMNGRRLHKQMREYEDSCGITA